MERQYYLNLFKERWNELEHDLPLEDEEGNHNLLDKDIFPKFFTSPELLVGFYIWRDLFYEDFMDEYDGWIDECKDIAIKAKEIFEHLPEDHITEKETENVCKSIKIYMNKEILNVIHLVLAYKDFLYCEAAFKNDTELRNSVTEKTEHYYYSLNLPYGMQKNKHDFEIIMSFSFGNRKLLQEIDNTPFEQLHKFVFNPCFFDDKTNAVNELLQVVDNAVQEFGSDFVDVVLNDETGNIYVSYCSRNNSFAITNKEWSLDDLEHDLLVEGLNERHVGVCGW